MCSISWKMLRCFCTLNWSPGPFPSLTPRWPPPFAGSSERSREFPSMRGNISLAVACGICWWWLRNPKDFQPPEMYKTLQIHNGINYQPQLVCRISSINRICCLFSGLFLGGILTLCIICSLLESSEMHDACHISNYRSCIKPPLLIWKPWQERESKGPLNGRDSQRVLLIPGLFTGFLGSGDGWIFEAKLPIKKTQRWTSNMNKKKTCASWSCLKQKSKTVLFVTSHPLPKQKDHTWLRASASLAT